MPVVGRPSENNLHGLRESWRWAACGVAERAALEFLERSRDIAAEAVVGTPRLREADVPGDGGCGL